MTKNYTTLMAKIELDRLQSFCFTKPLTQNCWLFTSHIFSLVQSYWLITLRNMHSQGISNFKIGEVAALGAGRVIQVNPVSAVPDAALCTLCNIYYKAIIVTAVDLLVSGHPKKIRSTHMHILYHIICHMSSGQNYIIHIYTYICYMYIYICYILLYKFNAMHKLGSSPIGCEDFSIPGGITNEVSV